MRFSDCAGRNVSERRAGPENAYCRSRAPTLRAKANAAAYRGMIQVFLIPVGGPAGVLATARQKGKPAQHGKPRPVTKCRSTRSP